MKKRNKYVKIMIKRGQKVLIFEKDDVSFKLLDVFALKQKNVKTFNSGRNFEALSFRVEADTIIKQGENTFELKDKSICYFPAGADYTRISNHENTIVIHFNSFGYSYKEIEMFSPKQYEKIESLFKEILDVWKKRSRGYRYTCTALFYQIFAEIYRQNYKGNAINPKIRDAVRYINHNFTDAELTVNVAAEKSNMSEVYFRKLFKEEFSVSPKKYIINLRIKQAAALIAMGYYSLSEVSEKSGFTDYKYFSTEFKRIMGVSPSKYFYNFLEIAKEQNLK
ncbi:MAG: helix-turn-helix transcriptional regulator [Ruminococcaceae bacterium]|nr:helix-turn-helix transcriptional regulator [Oscillospiraceae bacterium]